MKGDSNSNASDNTYLEGCWLATRIVRAEGKKLKKKGELKLEPPADR